MDPSFEFTRLGVRVPAVLVSPYIEPGTIDSTVYDHTSVIATAFKLLIPKVGNPYLTLRDKNANTFEKNLTRDAARTDAIDLGAPPQASPATQAHLDAKINDHLAAHVQNAAFLEQQLPPSQQSGRDPDTVLSQIKTEGAASTYIQNVAAKVRAVPQGQVGAAGTNP
jgi:phospholipase C